jgi:hypothetical protein
MSLDSDTPDVGSASEVLRRLLDHRHFVDVYGDVRPFLISTRNGARFSEVSWSPSVQESNTRESHQGQALSILGELGIPLTTPLTTFHQAGTLQEVLDDTIANFNDDLEPYWLALSLLLYMPDSPGWQNKYGHQFSFDELLLRLLAVPDPSGPCGGTHTLFVCAVALQISSEHPNTISHSVRERLERRLVSAAAKLADGQRPNGSWGRDWCAQARQQRKASHIALQEARAEEVWITGHHLEWLAITPTEFRISDERMSAAARYVVREMALTPREAIWENPCYYTHGPHAIQQLLKD